jgi:ribose-phosphate pyrophosphokinase
MQIYNSAGEIQFKTFVFPDGQPHVEIVSPPDACKDPVTIETAIRNPNELFQLLVTKDALESVGCYAVSLDIRYLMGGRMDRRIGIGHACTLNVVAKTLLRGAGFKQIRVLDPHSSATNALLGAKSVYPLRAVRSVLQNYDPHSTYILAPDAGSKPRVIELLKADSRVFTVIQGAKKRDPETGALSGFEILQKPDLRGRTVLIVDDICDGGRTFAGIAQEAFILGAEHVDLYVTHGVFSKPLPLGGIRRIWTTDSYADVSRRADLQLADSLRVIPVWMPEGLL